MGATIQRMDLSVAAIVCCLGGARVRAESGVEAA